jgi:hypothetical protein
VSLFSNYLSGIVIRYGNSYGSSSQAVCPYLFKNALIIEMDLFYQVNSFLFVSLFRFENNSRISKNDNIKSSIGSTVKTVSVNGYNYKLDTGLLHPLVFEQLTTFSCDGTLNSIQTDVFKHFGPLSILFVMNSLGNFYHNIGLTWLNHVHIGSNVSLSAADAELYTYPDQDFCIFATQFPRNRSIQLMLDDPWSNGTSFTFAWLCNNGATVLEGESQPSYFVNSTAVNAMLKLCEAKLDTQQQVSNVYPSYSDYYQTKLVDMLAFELVPFVLIPCSCLLGLFLNWKIIQTIHHNKKKELKEDFYKYMSANAKFNCIYCLIFVFYPMTSCNWRLSYSFCSSIFTSQFVQYYKIVMIAYFGEVFKMSANISYLMMTLNRYLLVGKDHNKWLITLAKLEFKWVIRVSLLFSVLINIGHGWEYQYIWDLALTRLNDFDYMQENGYSFSDYPQANQELTYFIYSIVYFIINFVIFFIINTGIEVKTVRRMHTELVEKRERIAKMRESSSATTAHEDKNKNDEDDKKERRGIKMVVLNGIFNFVLRAPDMLFWIGNKNVILSVFGSENKYVSTALMEFVPGLLGFIIDIGYLAYILTSITNFVIFYTFNKNFKKAVAIF